MPYDFTFVCAGYVPPTELFKKWGVGIRYGQVVRWDRVLLEAQGPRGKRLRGFFLAGISPDTMEGVTIPMMASLGKVIRGEILSLKMLAMKEHVSSLRKHIRDLSEKNYQKLYQVNSLDFVLLFIIIYERLN